jgi:hypothetical protein
LEFGGVPQVTFDLGEVAGFEQASDIAGAWAIALGLAAVRCFMCRQWPTT